MNGRLRNGAKYFAKIALLFIVYFVTARIGLRINAVSGFATLIWPPTGIALVAMYLLGYRYWPGVLLAAFAVNVVTGAPPLVALGIGIGNTLEAVCGTYLLRRFVNFKPSLDRVKDVLGLVLFAALISTLVSATIGVTSLWLGGIVQSAAIGATWIAWWVGDMLGVLVAAPLLFVWSNWRYVSIRPKHFLEAGAAIAVLAAISAIVFIGLQPGGIRPFMFGYLLFPVFVWIALRFGQRGAATATFIMAVIAIWSTTAGKHTVATSQVSHDLLLLQSFVGVTAVTFMTMAAVVAEREQTLKRQQLLEFHTATLTKQRLHLEALNQSKSEFISIASHQLRTPATAVKLYIGMLLGGYAGALTKRQRAMLQTANEGNERQLHVISELLDVAQLDTGKIKLKRETIAMTPFVTEVIARQNAAFTARQQHVEFSYGKNNIYASVDRVKFGTVLENILDNASKYTPNGKEIRVALARVKGGLAIAIADEGIGIRRKDLGKLFKKFSRIDSRAVEEAGGTGLGLYWARKIIRLHGGAITVVSRPGVGSTFKITLPTTQRSRNMQSQSKLRGTTAVRKRQLQKH